MAATRYEKIASLLSTTLAALAAAPEFLAVVATL
jgi:hypothetical protein